MLIFDSAADRAAALITQSIRYNTTTDGEWSRELEDEFMGDADTDDSVVEPCGTAGRQLVIWGTRNGSEWRVALTGCP